MGDEASSDVERAKAFVRRHFEESVNLKKHDVVLSNPTDDFYDHDGPNGQPTDREGDRQMVIRIHTQLPDLHVTIEDMIAEGDLVAPATIS